MLRDSKLVLVVAVAVGLWIPLARMEWFTSHEQTGYVLRTVEWAAELRVGELYPRWASDYYGGYGSPYFMFYAPAVYASAALLTSALSPFWALKLVVLGGSITSGVGSYALIFGETRQRDAALLGAVAFLASPYRLGDLYQRGDLSEFTSLAMLPVVLALYRAAALEAVPRRAGWLAVAASGCHAVMVLSHTILGLWGTLVVGAVVAASATGLVWNRCWIRAARLVVALACGPGLAAVYLVPAIAYRGLTRTALMIVGFYDPQNQLNPLHVLFDKSTPLFAKNFLAIGSLLAVSAFLTALGLLLNFKAARCALGWVALTIVLVGLTSPFASGFWAHGYFPLSQFIQFPWRLLGPASLTASVSLGIGAAAASARLSEQTKSGVAIALAAAILCVIAWPAAAAQELPTAGVPIDPETIRSGMYSTTNVDEYLPLAVPAVPSAPRGALVLSAHGAVVKRSDSEGSHHSLTISARKAGAEVSLGLHAFPGWGVKTLSGPAAATLDTDQRGLLRLNLPRPGSYDLRVAYGITPAGRLGTALSALSVLGLCLLLVRGSRWWPTPPPSERVSA